MAPLEGQVHAGGFAYPVRTLRFDPGCCIACSASPTAENGLEMVDFLLDMPDGRRLVLCATHCVEVAEAAGGWSAAQVARHKQAVDELEAELEQLRSVKAELDTLRRAVAHTLSNGATIGGRLHQAELKSPPGRRKVTVGDPV